MRGIDFKAVLAGIACAAHDNGLALHVHLLERVEHQFLTRQAQHLLNNLLGLRALHGQLPVVVALVLGHGVELLHLFAYPGKVLVDVGSVDDQEEALVALLIHQQVVDGSAIGVEHHAVEDFAHGGTADVVGEDVLHEFLSLAARHQHLAHVAHVEHTAGGSYGHVLIGNVGVLNWHLESTKGDHLGPFLDVSLIETSPFVTHDIW